MIMTIAMDSDTPSYQPCKTIIATTHITIKTTDLMAYNEISTFLVAISKIKNAKKPEIETPSRTPSKNAYSVYIQAQKTPAS